MSASVGEHELEALFVANDAFDELERALGVFCPFEAIGMVRQEVRHGQFLRYMLDPQRPHGFGAECLRALMSVAAGAISQGSTSTIHPLDVHLMDLDSALVPQREHKRIDILVEIPTAKVVVAIELKIEASEHSGQLGRYRKLVETDWPSTDWRHVLLFLTKRGDYPSVEDGKGWHPLPLESLLPALDAVLARGEGAPDARVMLAAYLAMLRRRHLTDQRLEELAASLWAKHREALEFLADRRPDAYSEIFELLTQQSGSIVTCSPFSGR